MGEGNSLINLGDISKPVTVLIEKISDAIGIVYEPHQMKQIAKAEVAIEKIKALGKIENLHEVQQRALARFVNEETIKQVNMEAIIEEAIPNIKPDAETQNVENDWISNFFDKSKLISDKEIQLLWANILSGEANNPGTFSKRTVNSMSSLDKDDAIIFRNLCSFAWNIGPLIFDTNAEIYKKNLINFGSLQHLENIGLINFSHVSGFKRSPYPKNIFIEYCGKQILIKFNKTEDNDLKIGKVLFSQIGGELYKIVNTNPVPDFFEYTIKSLKEKNPNIETIEEI